MNYTRKQLTSEVKGRIYQAIADGHSSKDIREKYGLTPSQMHYYKNTICNWRPFEEPSESQLSQKTLDGKTDLVKSIVSAFNDLKKKKKSEIEQALLKKKNEKSIGATTTPNCKSYKKIYITDKSLIADENSGNYLKFTIDGVEILIRKDARQVVIEEENIYIVRN